MIWVNNYGKGRVYNNVLGHDVEAMADPSFRAWMLRGVIWAANKGVLARRPARLACEHAAAFPRRVPRQDEGRLDRPDGRCGRRLGRPSFATRARSCRPPRFLTGSPR